ncbi:hypothetical protein CRUP_023963 [Coryphaenoides rupestris]|nr:hypothetical protein CRUP_023963 [Coryphaenoides rupestris]
MRGLAGVVVVVVVEVQRASGKVLFDLVCTHLNLIEGGYFGLEFQDHHKMLVPVCSPGEAGPRRWTSALQRQQRCSDAKIGDFEGSQSRSHLLNNNYIPDQMALMGRIMEYHSKNKGQTPAVSDYQLLEVARRLEMYGVRLHPAKDREGTQLSLAVSHGGVLVFQGHTQINAFNWSKVRKLSFKRKRFLIKLRADLNSSYQDTLEFLMGSRDCCKVFWKICVEYHAFFRLFEEPKPKPVLFTRGSSFRFRLLLPADTSQPRPRPRHRPEERTPPRAQTDASPQRRGARQQGGATHPDHLNTGPPSPWSTLLASGFFSSDSYVGCHNLDNGEYNAVATGGQVGVSNTYGGGVSGGTGQDDFLGWLSYRAVPSPALARALLRMVGGETDEAPQILLYHSSGSGISSQQGALHCPPVEDGIGGGLQQQQHSRSPLVVQQTMGPAGSAEEDGSYACSADFLSYDAHSYSSLSIRGHQNFPSPHHSFQRSNHQVHDRSVPSRADRMAALERRMLSNSGGTPSPRKCSDVGPGHVNDCFNPSGSSESDSEAETNPITDGRSGYVLAGGHPVEAVPPRHSYSLDSLQLEDGVAVDESHAFTDEDFCC